MRAVCFGGVLAGLGTLGACSMPTAGMSSAVGREALLEQAKEALSAGECVDAINSIEPLYQSEYSNNEIRELRAAAHACMAGMPSLLGVMVDIVENAAELGNPGGLWKVLSGMTYDADRDAVARKYTSALAATDALRTILIPDQVIALPNRIETDPFNLASLLISDRPANAILYNLFVSMVTVGLLENYGGQPNEDNQRTVNLGANNTIADGWKALANIDETACGFAGEVVSLIDSIDASAEVLPESVKETLQTVSTLYGSLLNAECENACDSDVAVGVAGCDYGSSVCSGTDSRPCLAALRNRNLCKTQDDTTLVDDYARCAAAGVATFVNDFPVLGWEAE